MKLLKMLRYDINEGTIKYWYRYLFVVFVGIINCCVCHAQISYVEEIYNMNTSMWEYGTWSMIGRPPYIYRANGSDTFYLPYAWIMQYICLAFLIGGYVKQDMSGYGVHFMYKSKKRTTWWLSKVIWCVFVNVIFFGISWLTYFSCSWINAGNNAFNINKPILRTISNYVLSSENFERIAVVIILPFMVGVIHSLIQIIVSINWGDEIAMVIIGIILVISSYYSHPLLVSGYSMSSRYSNIGNIGEFQLLEYRFGLIYLCCVIILLCIIGGINVKRKNIYW